jgi:putative phosphoesterase
MIIGAYSDLHSNLPAFEALLTVTSGRVDQWLCAGDSVGLFPQVNQVLDLQRKHNVIAVLGDHERMLLSGECMAHSYTGNQALIVQRREISESNKAYLSDLKDSLDLELDGVRIKLTHNIHLTDWEVSRKYNIKQDELDAQYLGFDYVVFGHTHLATVLYGRNVIALNPGSAGFPVDAGHRPSAILLDTRLRTFEFVRFDMDTILLRKCIKDAKYNPKLIEYLDNNFRWN